MTSSLAIERSEAVVVFVGAHGVLHLSFLCGSSEGDTVLAPVRVLILLVSSGYVTKNAALHRPLVCGRIVSRKKRDFVGKTKIG